MSRGSISVHRSICPNPLTYAPWKFFWLTAPQPRVLVPISSAPLETFIDIVYFRAADSNIHGKIWVPSCRSSSACHRIHGILISPLMIVLPLPHCPWSPQKKSYHQFCYLFSKSACCPSISPCIAHFPPYFMHPCTSHRPMQPYTSHRPMHLCTPRRSMHQYTSHIHEHPYTPSRLIRPYNPRLITLIPHTDESTFYVTPMHPCTSRAPNQSCTAHGCMHPHKPRLGHPRTSHRPIYLHALHMPMCLYTSHTRAALYPLWR